MVVVVVSATDGLAGAHAEARGESEAQGRERVVRVHGWWGGVARQGGVRVLGKTMQKRNRENHLSLMQIDLN